MDTEELISEATLARLWRVDPKTIIKWRNRGRIDSDIKEPSNRGFHHYYRLESVDAYHSAHSSGFGPEMPIPTVKQLLWSERGLLKPEEAAALYGCTLDSILRYLREGSVPGFYLGNQRSARLPATLTAVMASSANGYVSIETAARVLCVAPAYVQRLMRDGRLTGKQVIGDGRAKQVERKSLLALLAMLIAPFISPEQWWEKMLQTQGPVLSKDQVTTKYQVHDRSLSRLIAENSRSLPYIRTMSTKPQTLIPAWGVQTFLREEGERLPEEDLTVLFGVSQEQAASWHRPHALCRRWHEQAWHGCPSKRCVREYITGHRTHPDVEHDEWLTVTLERGLPAVSADELIATTPLLEFEDIEQAVANGLLRGVRLPIWQGERGIAFTRPEAMGFRRVWGRQLNLAEY